MLVQHIDGDVNTNGAIIYRKFLNTNTCGHTTANTERS